MAAYPDRGRLLLGLLCALGAGLSAPLAWAEQDAAPPPRRLILYSGASPELIAHWLGELGEADPQARARAHEQLTTLDAASVPGIKASLDRLLRHRPKAEATRSALTAIRHAVGSRRADDEVDIAPGVLQVLNQDRSPAVLAVAAPLLLLRSLESIANPAAVAQIARLATVDKGLFRHELRLSRKRMGLAALPGLIALRSNEHKAVRRWAQRGVRALGMTAPKAAINLEDPYLAAQVIHAYTKPLDYNAMPEIVKQVAHSRLQVREAARQGVARFGRGAIWQLRERYEERTGRAAERRWNAERTARELYAVIDGSAIEAAETTLAKGHAAFLRGDLSTMRKHFDQILLKMPAYPERAKMAPGYAALGAELSAKDELQAAHDAYGRALRLAPQAEDASQWRGQLAFLRAEIALSRGVVDLDGYARALDHDPDHPTALAVSEQLSGKRQARIRARKQWAAGGAALLLLLLSVALLRGVREDRLKHEREAEA